jgi:hypothetical protein
MTEEDEPMFELIGLAIALGVGVGSFAKTRTFVKRRLRYVDAVQKGTAPIIAGAAAAIVAAPVVAALPIITGATALALGAGIGFGTHAGAKDIRENRDDD